MTMESANLTQVQASLNLLLPFALSSFVGGFIGDAANRSVTITNCYNSISGTIASDNILGGAVGRNNILLTISGLVTIFNHMVNQTQPAYVNAILLTQNRICTNCYANTTAGAVYTYKVINSSGNTYNLSNSSWNTSTNGTPQLIINSPVINNTLTIFPPSNFSCNSSNVGATCAT